MDRFLVVLKYELKEYFTNKVFMGLTIALALLGAAALFLPRFVDMSGFTGVETVGGADDADEDQGEKDIFLYVDQVGAVRAEILQEMFPEVLWQAAEDADALQKAVESQEAAAGFLVTGNTEYEYFVFNKSMTDRNAVMFEQAMKLFYRMDYCQERGMDLEEISLMYDVPITVTEQILNKDS